MKNFEPQKKSVFLVGETVRVCHALSIEDIQWSASINSVFQQYMILIDENVPNLTKEQWNIFYHVHKNPLPKNQTVLDEIKSLKFRVIEFLSSSNQSDEVEIANLAILISKFTTSQTLAVIYKSKEYWKSKM